MSHAAPNSHIEFFPLARATFLTVDSAALQLRKKEFPPRFPIFALAHAMPPLPSTTDGSKVSLEYGGAEFLLSESMPQGDEKN